MILPNDLRAWCSGGLLWGMGKNTKKRSLSDSIQTGFRNRGSVSIE